ncbi:MAG: molybdopterin molybdotransferase MoeA, partial [Burkholderiaceae bacterium]
EREVGALLSLAKGLGIDDVEVIYRQLKVAVVSVGDELRDVHQPLYTGLIHDSNRLMLLDLVRRAGAQPIDLGITPDDPTSLRSALKHAANVADMVISSGGVSVGEADHTRKVLRELGEIKFWRLAIKPGRPLAYGLLQTELEAAIPFFGLPGNPVASFVSFLALVRHAIGKRAGNVRPSIQSTIRAKLVKATRKQIGRTEFLRCWLKRDEAGHWLAEVMPSQGAANLFSLTQADGLVVLPHDLDALKLESWVDVIDLKNNNL